MPPPPQINLAARTHPLAGGEAEHRGVLLREEEQAKLDQERAEGARSPAYDDAEPSDSIKTHSEDEYSSDEERETRKSKGLVKRLKGEAKVISGKIRRDEGRVHEGKEMMASS
ncbi:hypothetical protein C8R43DRAFT_1048684 [Mycena crocata]|nr:hypothetical protein C8R43DRAFT_1048684 [Mycena crocata]